MLETVVEVQAARMYGYRKMREGDEEKGIVEEIVLHCAVEMCWQIWSSKEGTKSVRKVSCNEGRDGERGVSMQVRT